MTTKLSYGERAHLDWEANRDRQLLALFIDNRASGRLLNLGCGEGREVDAILLAKPGLLSEKVVGLDVHLPSLKKAKARGIQVVLADLAFGIPFKDSSFDALFSNQVIEHVHDLDNFTAEMNRILKMGGMAIVSTENLASWDNIAALLLGHTPFSMQYSRRFNYGVFRLSPHYRKADVPPYPPHDKILTLKALVAFLQGNGFKTEAVMASGYPPFFGKISRVLEKLDLIHCRFVSVKATKLGSNPSSSAPSSQAADPPVQAQDLAR